MFNRGKFNTQRFNLPEKQSVIYIREAMLESVESESEINFNIYFTLGAEENISADARGSVKVYENPAYLEEIGATAIVVCDYFTSESMAEAIAVSTKVTVNCHIRGAMTEAIGAAVDVVEDIHLHEAISEAVKFNGKLTAKYTAEEIACYAIINALVSTAVFDTSFAVIDVSIPSGGKLVLDSENFVALLNNANVLDKHSGAWVEINRNVFEIKVDSGSTAQLEINMLYTEHYL